MSLRARERTGAAGLEALITGIGPARAASPEEVQAHLDRLTKPPGSLGGLEDLARRLARILGDPPPELVHRTVFVLAGDHGVARTGVSAYPPEVTAQMCRNFARGGAAINAIAGATGARVVVADLAVDAEADALGGIRDLKVRRGTRDLSRGPALTREEAHRAVLHGATLVEEALPNLHVAALGEMGIGNTTAASALTCALTGCSAHEVVGPGTGVGDEGLARKRDAVTRGVARVGPGAAPLDVLAELGGGEIAGLVGVTLAAARAGRPVVTDGFIATAAVLVAQRLAPAVSDYVFASHRSAEPGHAILLEALDLTPIFDLGLRLGEGTGAALAFPLLDAAGAVLREMATFQAAGVSGPERPAAASAGGPAPA